MRYVLAELAGFANCTNPHRRRQKRPRRLHHLPNLISPPQECLGCGRLAANLAITARRGVRDLVGAVAEPAGR